MQRGALQKIVFKKIMFFFPVPEKQKHAQKPSIVLFRAKCKKTPSFSKKNTRRLDLNPSKKLRPDQFLIETIIFYKNNENFFVCFEKLLKLQNCFLQLQEVSQPFSESSWTHGFQTSKSFFPWL